MKNLHLFNLIFAGSLFLFAGCTIYDTVDDLPTAIAEGDSSSSRIEDNLSSSEKGDSKVSSEKASSEASSSSESSSSVTKHDTSYVVIITQSSSSEGKSSSAESSSSKGISSSSEKTEPESSSSVAQTSSSEENLSSSIVSSNSAESSSSIQSSSSSEISSSSVSEWTCGDSTVTKGGYAYKTVVIKEQCWTAENMRYETSDGSICYDSVDANCETYGRLYTHSVAGNACPSGWRLPTSDEYVALADYTEQDLDEAGAYFKSENGWQGDPGSGNNLLQFSALPGGYCDDEIECYGIGVRGYWWTSTAVNVQKASYYTFFLTGDADSYSATTKLFTTDYASVRCIKK